jgi:hypothetical protein
MPSRASANLTAKERERMQQTHEQQLLIQSRQAGYQQPCPVLQAPRSYVCASNNQPISNGHASDLNQAIGAVSIQEKVNVLLHNYAIKMFCCQ